MTKEITELQSFTVEEFEKDFDAIMDKVNDGESFMIRGEHGNAVIVPYKEIVEIFKECNLDEDLIRIHTEHNEGS